MGVSDGTLQLWFEVIDRFTNVVFVFFAVYAFVYPLDSEQTLEQLGFGAIPKY